MAIRKPMLSVVEARRLALALPEGEQAVELDRTLTTRQRPERQAVMEAPGPAAGERDILAAQVNAEAVERVQVFLSALLPAQGTSAIYDQLCLEYRSAKALQMILRRALDDYETLLESRAVRISAPAYASICTIVQTSRMMPVKLLAIARAQFDPLGLESGRTFGRKLASAALATFFDNERRRSR